MNLILSVNYQINGAAGLGSWGSLAKIGGSILILGLAIRVFYLLNKMATSGRGTDSMEHVRGMIWSIVGAAMISAILEYTV